MIVFWLVIYFVVQFRQFLWQFLFGNPLLTFVVILLILVAATALASLAYGISIQRNLKGKG